VTGIESAAIDHLRDLPWRENVTQLESVVKQLLATADGEVMTAAAARMLTASWDRLMGTNGRRAPGTIEPGARAGAGSTDAGDVWSRLERDIHEAIGLLYATASGEPPDDIHGVLLGEAEKQVIMTVYGRTGKNQSEAARVLGVSRNNLRAKLKTYGEI
jgi:DNA-binding NtrC family response regulator